MKVLLCEPNAERVNHACEKFDEQFKVTENALGELFSLFPVNTDPSHVLLKVVVLNRLYSTQILAVHAVADHIYQIGREIDDELAAGSLEIVKKIATVKIGEKERVNFSFASKFCNWHRQEIYPIYDSHVDKYLWGLLKQVSYTDPIFTHDSLWNYPEFVKVMESFRKHYGLDLFTFKQVDKFIWLQGEQSSAV